MAEDTDRPVQVRQGVRAVTESTQSTCDCSSLEDDKTHGSTEQQQQQQQVVSLHSSATNEKEVTFGDTTTRREEQIRQRATSLFRLESELDVEHQHPQSLNGRGTAPTTLRYRSRPQIMEYSSSDDGSEGLGGNLLQTTSQSFDVPHPLQSLIKRTPTLTPDEIQKIPRLVHRNLPFHQSRQKIAVRNVNARWSARLIYTILQDWYHVILRWPTFFSIVALVSIWTIAILLFAVLYRHLDRIAIDNDDNCRLGKDGVEFGFPPSFAFSLETCTTVGYGLPNGGNSFFEPQCYQIRIAIYFQMVWSMLFNAFLFAFLFARLARCENRGAQVLFGKKAIIEKRNGKWCLHVRVYDMDSAQPVVEAHVRMYCVSWRDYQRQTRDYVQPHLLHDMRILHPNDELGANMFTSIPANVTHQIDAYSALAPPTLREEVNTKSSHGIVYREVDSPGNACPVCGEVYDSLEQLERHIAYKRIEESVSPNFPIKGSHRDSDLVKDALIKPIELTEQDIIEQLRDKEIMCIVEGIEPMVSGTFQALQSYKLEDIVFGGTFAPCMSQRDGQIYVDLGQFHKIDQPSDQSIHNYPIQAAVSSITEDKNNWRKSITGRR